MNEIYKLLQNIQEIVRANNLFLESLEKRMQAIEAALVRFDKTLTLDLTPETSGADNEDEE